MMRHPIRLSLGSQRACLPMRRRARDGPDVDEDTDEDTGEKLLWQEHKTARYEDSDDDAIGHHQTCFRMRQRVCPRPEDDEDTYEELLRQVHETDTNEERDDEEVKIGTIRRRAPYLRIRRSAFCESVGDGDTDKEPVSQEYKVHESVDTPARLSNNAETQHLSLMATSSKNAPRFNYDHLTVSTISDWLVICNEKHHGHCLSFQSASGQSDGLPLWLYDQQDQCLVPAEPTCRYAAVSYVWGQVKMVQTMKNNLDKFRQHAGIQYHELPRTIQHAAWLARNLDIRYLWVDSLCLVQDDEKIKRDQINKMAGIYANAYLTLVAAVGGDAHAGIGVVEKLQVKTLPKEDHRDLASGTFLKVGSAWVERGWTLQELLFSRRVILLFEETASWECCCAISHGCLPFAKPSRGDLVHRNSIMQKARTLSYNAWPDLEEYARLVCEYSARNLSFPEDVYKAFHGIMSTFGYTFDHGMLIGLPEMFFDIALLWQPFGSIQRRSATQSAFKSQRLPSWSWMGWRGQLDPRSWACGYDYVQEVNPNFRRKIRWSTTSLSIKSTIKWYCGSAGTEMKRLIICESHKYKNQQPDPLPQGWQKCRPESAHGSPYFRHASDISTKFSFPVPIRDTALPLQRKEPTPLLFCRTRRAYLKLGTPLRRTEIGGEVVSLSLLKMMSLKAEWAGALRLNYRSEIYEFGSPCELVEISAGSADNSCNEGCFLDEWWHPDRPKEEKLYEFYNVLWIEWVDGVAYRKALGRVLKAIWDGTVTETLDLILG